MLRRIANTFIDRVLGQGLNKSKQVEPFLYIEYNMCLYIFYIDVFRYRDLAGR